MEEEEGRKDRKDIDSEMPGSMFPQPKTTRSCKNNPLKDERRREHFLRGQWRRVFESYLPTEEDAARLRGQQFTSDGCSTEFDFLLAKQAVGRALDEVERGSSRADLPAAEVERLRASAAQQWDGFYGLHENRFFQSRHWLLREFASVLRHEDAEMARTFLEVGCGTGSTLFSLLEWFPRSRFLACDYSARAVQLVREHERFDAERMHCFECDLARNGAPELDACAGECDVATALFVLSALDPEELEPAVRNIVRALRARGTLLLRDYGMYDMTQLRFIAKEGRRLQKPNFYARVDGTRTHFLELEETRCVLERCGLRLLKHEYVTIELKNRKTGEIMPRVFVQTIAEKI